MSWAAKARQVEAELLTRIPEHKLRPRLEPTRRAVELMGDPQKSYRIVHVTGTNGKTSTTRMIERLLREMGLRTGRFTSPHLVRLNERMAIDGDPVSDERLFEVWTDIAPVLEIVDAELEAAGDTKLTFFEALAVLGFAVFADAPVDVLVLEVGMGGEWDSTNVADGDVAVFTPISIDHAERLGNTVAEIAKTKSGIIKPSAYVISSPQDSEALEVLKAKSSAVADHFALFGTEFGASDIRVEAGGQRFNIKGLAREYEDLFIPLHGAHQVQNAAVAVAAVEAFVGGGTNPIADDVIRAALADVSSPGRLQVIDREPLTILDAAHNPGGAVTLAQALKENFGSPKAVGVLSMLGDKDAEHFFETLKGSFDRVVITQSSSPRAVPFEELEVVARGYFENVETAPNAKAALALAKTYELDAIVVAGSISLAGDVLKDIQLDDDYEDENEANEMEHQDGE
ncbi:MAG: bifunctional folylpolyglutamate synthase/dihydrofolate synthase [Rhodoluna sp.]|nr:bifunctional folylpolyglutamate synthase/dihydrofolate synthase [Rhodoluna sp.]